MNLSLQCCCYFHDDRCCLSSAPCASRHVAWFPFPVDWQVRESIVLLLSFLAVYTFSFGALTRFLRFAARGRTSSRSRRDDSASDFPGAAPGSERSAVTATATDAWRELRRGARSPVVLVAALALAMALSALSILPITILANEVLLAYAGNFYVRWLDASLVLGYWNWVFVGCNLNLFVLMPFA